MVNRIPAPITLAHVLAERPLTYDRKGVPLGHERRQFTDVDAAGRWAGAGGQVWRASRHGGWMATTTV